MGVDGRLAYAALIVAPVVVHNGELAALVLLPCVCVTQAYEDVVVGRRVFRVEYVVVHSYADIRAVRLVVVVFLRVLYVFKTHFRRGEPSVLDTITAYDAKARPLVLYGPDYEGRQVYAKRKSLVFDYDNLGFFLRLAFLALCRGAAGGGGARRRGVLLRLDLTK